MAADEEVAMRVAIGCDHNGFEMKSHLVAAVRRMGHEVLDVGAHEHDPTDDYPDFSFAVADAVRTGDADRGIIVCGSGVGASVAANKVRGVRAAVCHDTYSAAQGVEHDDMNVLCIGSLVVGRSVAEQLVGAFLGAEFSGAERHRRRLEKVLKRER
jgi:ribose 5-phosphate isomerase B